MSFKILQFIILASTFSFAQIVDYEELFNFSFGSSKEVVNKIWQMSSYAKFGDLAFISEDTLQIKNDDFKYIDGWQFFLSKIAFTKYRCFLKF